MLESSSSKLRERVILVYSLYLIFVNSLIFLIAWPLLLYKSQLELCYLTCRCTRVLLMAEMPRRIYISGSAAIKSNERWFKLSAEICSCHQSPQCGTPDYTITLCRGSKSRFGICLWDTILGCRTGVSVIVNHQDFPRWTYPVMNRSEVVPAI